MVVGQPTRFEARLWRPREGVHPRVLALIMGFLIAGCGATARPSAAQGDGAGLSAFSQELQTLADRLSTSVVQIISSGYAPVEASEASATSLLATRRSSGSGVVLTPDGYIITNAHVVAGAHTIEVLIPADDATNERRSIIGPPSRTVPAELIGVDSETDLAVLRVDVENMDHLEFGDSDSLGAGQIVLAFGSPFGLEGSVSMGVVSSVARQLESESPMVYVQTDTAINPGNSGGPLVDLTGRVVGINTMIVSPSGASAGVGFSVPSNIVRTVFEQIRDHGRVRRGMIGVNAQTITPQLAEGLRLDQDWGVVLADVYPGGPAFDAGLSIGDVILSVDGRIMENGRQFDVNLYQRQFGDTVTLDVRRGEEQFTVTVVVVERANDSNRFSPLVDPQENVIERLGVLAIDMTPAVARMLGGQLRHQEGVVVAAAVPGATEQQRLVVGDIIVSVNRRLTRSLEELRAALRWAAEISVVVQVERSGAMHFVTFDTVRAHD